MSDDLGVPCPACGSLQVLVGPRTRDRRESADPALAPGHISRLHDCACRECAHNFRHDFAFSR